MKLMTYSQTKAPVPRTAKPGTASAPSRRRSWRLEFGGESHACQLLRQCSSWNEQHDTLGDYFLVAAHTHGVLARHVNVKQLARDLSVLPENIVVEDDHTYTDGEVPAATQEDER
jgi:hypothetical protein